MFHAPRSSLVRSLISGTPYICRACLLRQTRRGINPRYQPWTASHSLQTETAAEEVVPFRKQLKDEAKKKRLEAGGKPPKKKPKTEDPKHEKWELTVGIEIHAELNTARKLFSSAATSLNDAPNTHVALFDAAFPGAQPHFQKETLIPALRAAIALNCNIQRKSSFDRKHYFYQDQPAGYQITQYYEPFARDGHLTLYPHDGIDPSDFPSLTIGIKQVQMEQDTAKTLHQPSAAGDQYLLDFNRVSHPLIEIITLPHIHSPATAAACVRKIQALLKSVDALAAGMELGGLRADVNVSVRQRGRPPVPGSQGAEYYGVTGLGQRTEIKNLSSFKAVEDAIVAERDRQIRVLEAGGVVEGETRGWTLGSKETRKLRGKEGEVDYRYMPDPDLGPVIIGDDLVQHLRDSLPMLPDDTASMLTSDEYGLTMKDAKTLAILDDGDRLDYYLDVVELLKQGLSAEEMASNKVEKVAANWVLHELGGLFTDTPWSPSRVPSPQLASLISHLIRRQITGRTAKQLLSTLFTTNDSRFVAQIIHDENLLLRPMEREEYVVLARELLDANPEMVRAVVEKGQRGKIGWFVGQMVRRGEEGRVEAARAEEAVRELLGV